MEIGNQIRALRAQRGVTQETVAEALGVLPQTVSKWETGATAPDIALLPAISAYFGVTIDELFALTDEQRVERIRNMLWDQRDADEAALGREAAFLLDKARREPKNSEPMAVLAWMENYMADGHHRRAEYYAKEALGRDPDDRNAHAELAEAVGIGYPDWYAGTHRWIIDWYEEFIGKNPTCRRAYMWLMDALMEDGRLGEAGEWCERMGRIEHTFRTPDYRAKIAWLRGEREKAMEIWEEMCREFPDDWMAWAKRGDSLAAGGEYELAARCYEEAKKHQSAPRFTDPQEALAQLYERLGDIPAAIASLEEEIEIMRTDWNTTDGETVDAVKREIGRLKGKL